jgi:hypothetical protein
MSSSKEKDAAAIMKDPPELKEPIFFDCCTFSQERMIALANGSYQDRIDASISASKANPKEIVQHAPMTFLEHFVSTIFLAFGVPVAVFNIPPLLYLFGKFVVGNVGQTFLAFALLVLLPLFIIPQAFNPELLQGWLAICMLKYFSWRYVIEEFPHPNRPRIMVGPPHGVFP